MESMTVLVWIILGKSLQSVYFFIPDHPSKNYSLELRLKTQMTAGRCAFSNDLDSIMVEL